MLTDHTPIVWLCWCVIKDPFRFGSTCISSARHRILNIGVSKEIPWLSSMIHNAQTKIPHHHHQRHLSSLRYYKNVEQFGQPEQKVSHLHRHSLIARHRDVVNTHTPSAREILFDYWFYILNGPLSLLAIAIVSFFVSLVIPYECALCWFLFSFSNVSDIKLLTTYRTRKSATQTHNTHTVSHTHTSLSWSTKPTMFEMID